MNSCLTLAKVKSTYNTRNTGMTFDNSSNVISYALFAISIIAAVIFNIAVKNKIKKRESFSGVAWGLFNGLFGVGFIWVAIATSSIHTEINKLDPKKDKKYIEEAREQLKYCGWTYGICLLVWIVIAVLLFINKSY